jgi:hypothetical protein
MLLYAVGVECSIGFQPVSGSTTQSLVFMHREPNRIGSSEAAQCKSNTGWKPVLHWAKIAV